MSFSLLKIKELIWSNFYVKNILLLDCTAQKPYFCAVFFLNLKNALVASCNNQNDTDNVRYIGSLDFIKKSVELIFNLDGNVKVAL